MCFGRIEALHELRTSKMHSIFRTQCTTWQHHFLRLSRCMPKVQSCYTKYPPKTQQINKFYL